MTIIDQEWVMFFLEIGVKPTPDYIDYIRSQNQASQEIINLLTHGECV